MDFGFAFFFNSILFGIALAMDAFSVSLANGLNEPMMKPAKMCGVAGMFSVLQFLMPMLGWACVCTLSRYFGIFEKLIPWIALFLLLYIGGKMLWEGIKNKDSDELTPVSGFLALLVQGIATSIDALSVGFTISEYDRIHALVECLVIGIITFMLCLTGIFIGKKVGTKLAGKAGIFGGAILIFIGIEIFVMSWF